MCWGNDWIPSGAEIQDTLGKAHIAETLQLCNYSLDFNIIQDAESTPRFEKKKKN